MRTRARIRAVQVGACREDAAHWEGGRAITVLAVILQKKYASGLRRPLVDKSKTVRAVSREKFEADKRVAAEFFLPAGAGSGKARLLQATGRQHELACDSGGSDRVAGGV